MPPVSSGRTAARPLNVFARAKTPTKQMAQPARTAALFAPPDARSPANEKMPAPTQVVTTSVVSPVKPRLFASLFGLLAVLAA